MLRRYMPVWSFQISVYHVWMQIVLVATLVVAGAVASWLSTAANRQENHNLGKSNWRDGCQRDEWCVLNPNILC